MQNFASENAANEIQKNTKLTKENVKKYMPLCLVLICALIVVVFLSNAISGVGGVDGLFILSGSAESDFIKFDKDGTYQWSKGDGRESGEWVSESDKIVFTSSEGKTQSARLVDQKYIAILGDDFLSGEIAQGALFDAEVSSVNGEVYTFKSDGKVYTTDDGRNTEYGTYMTDGHFIIVTTQEGSITYLNCGDGITGVFYKAS